MQCPECGSKEIMRSGKQTVGITEFWDEDGLISYETGDFYNWVGTIKYECLICEHQWTEEAESATL